MSEDFTSDVKSQRQALRRRHPTFRAARVTPGGWSSNTVAAGELALLLAAYDVHHARMMDSSAPTTGTEPLAAGQVSNGIDITL